MTSDPYWRLDDLVHLAGGCKWDEMTAEFETALSVASDPRLGGRDAAALRSTGVEPCCMGHISRRPADIVCHKSRARQKTALCLSDSF